MVILSKFAETLLSLMEEKGLNAPALAKALGTDRSNITAICTDNACLLFRFLLTLSNFSTCQPTYCSVLAITLNQQSFCPYLLLARNCGQ